MIQDYERGSGIHGATKSLVGERIVAVLLIDNILNLFFESGCAVAIRAHDCGAVDVAPMNEDDTPAYVKTLIRFTDKCQADLDVVIGRLTDRKCPGADGYYADASEAIK